MKKLLFILLFVICSPTAAIFAQEVNFGQYATEGIILTNVSSNSSLDFGTVLRNGGLYQIQLSDPEVVVFSIQAEYDKDVFVTLSPPTDLVLDASNTIPFTLRAAYANKGSNSIAQARIISGTTARFAVLERTSGPPGPPPTPKHEGYTTPTATAYLYIYGDINVGNVSAGFYTANIDISVSYE